MAISITHRMAPVSATIVMFSIWPGVMSRRWVHQRNTGAEVFNLGTGSGVSVLDLISALWRVTGQPIASRITARRPVDVPIYLADPARAKEVLGWQTVLEVDRVF